MKKLIFLAITALLLTSCEDWDCIEGTGSPIERTYSATELESLSLSGPFDLEFEQSSEVSLRISAQSEVLDAIRVEMTGGDMSIRFRNRLRCIDPNAPVIVYLTGPSLEELNLSGDGNINLQNLDLEELDIDISGNYDLRADGEVREMDIRVSGSADLLCYPLTVRRMDLNVSGNTDAELTITEDLDLRVSGNADIGYRGNPKISQNVSGNLDLRKMD